MQHISSTKGAFVAEYWEVIRRLREERGLTQKDVAQAIGVGSKTISGWEAPEWESGSREPNFPAVRRLAAFFGVRPGYIMGDEGGLIVAEDRKAVVDQPTFDLVEQMQKLPPDKRRELSAFASMLLSSWGFGPEKREGAK